MLDNHNVKEIAKEAFFYIETVKKNVDLNEMDQIIETFIFDQIKSKTTEIKIVSEEYGNLVLGIPKQTIIIDPIDGSGNLIRGIPIYSVAIALCNGDLQEVGVEDIEYSIVVSTFGLFEARKEDMIEEQNVDILSISEALIRCIRPFRMRLLGASTVELCLLAKGSIDGFIEKNGLKSVDLLPVLLILKNHGCYFSDTYGNELKFSLSNPKDNCYKIIASRSKDLFEKLLNDVKEQMHE